MASQQQTVEKPIVAASPVEFTLPSLKELCEAARHAATTVEDLPTSVHNTTRMAADQRMNRVSTYGSAGAGGLMVWGHIE